MKKLTKDMILADLRRALPVIYPDRWESVIRFLEVELSKKPVIEQGREFLLKTGRVTRTVHTTGIACRLEMSTERIDVLDNLEVRENVVTSGIRVHLEIDGVSGQEET